MYTLTINAIGTKEIINVAFRANAETLADQYYHCDDVYAVEIIDNATGELLYYKSKGNEG